MKVLTPHPISLISSSVAVNSEPEWSGGTTYSLGNIVKVTTATPHKLYKSLRDNNLNRPPAEWIEPVSEIATSSTTLTVGISAQSLTIETGKGYSAGMIVLITKTVTPKSVSMTGEVESYNPLTGVMLVNIYALTGSGDHASWTITSADEIGFWQEIGATNQYKMFDAYVNTQTVSADEIEVKLDVEKVGHVVLLGVSGIKVEFELWNSAETEMYLAKTADLVYASATITSVTDWYEYFFGSFSLKTDISESLGVAIQKGVLIIRIIATSGEDAKCGLCVTGRANYLGKSLYGMKAGLVDYSSRNEDRDTGLITIDQGYWAKQNSISLKIDNANIDHVYRTVTELRGVPTVWLGNNDNTGYELLMVYGIVTDFDITIPGPIKSYAALEILGLI